MACVAVRGCFPCELPEEHREQICMEALAIYVKSQPEGDKGGETDLSGLPPAVVEAHMKAMQRENGIKWNG